MLGELTLHYQHLAATADRATAADGINIHAKGAGSLQEGGAQREAPALARGSENYESVLVTHG